MKILTVENILQIHESVIHSYELQGLAKDKSIESVIARIDNRIAYGMIEDVYELAACYCAYIAIGHGFNDANKRTAFAAMDTCLVVNGIELEYKTEEVGDLVIKLAQGQIEDDDFAHWLRAQVILNK